MRPSEQLRFCAHELAAMARTGSEFATNDYDRDRFRRMLTIGEEMAAMTIDAEFTPERALPGGYAEVGSPPSVNALRELHEETGFHAKLERSSSPAAWAKPTRLQRPQGRRPKVYICCLRARITGGDASPSVETPEVVLADLGELPENMSLLQRTLLADSLLKDAPAVYQ